MTISFSTTWPDKMGELAGQPTYFVEKIWRGFDTNNVVSDEGYNQFFESSLMYEKYDFCKDALIDSSPKIHTIRKKSNRNWQEGTPIDFKIWTGKPYHSKTFAFAPRIECKGVQDIFITYPGYGDMLEITVDDNYLYYPEQEKIALNDGFDSYDDFFKWFQPLCGDDGWAGQIIHWTDLKC